MRRCPSEDRRGHRQARARARRIGRRYCLRVACCLRPPWHAADRPLRRRVWTALAIEECRLLTIAAAWHLVAARCAPPNSPSEWTGWQVVNPDGERRRYRDRIAAKLCARCGSNPPRSDRRTCEACAAGAAARSAALRARRKLAGLCADCGRPTTGGHVRCADCRQGQHGKIHFEMPRPGIYCTQCGARPGLAGPAWICRVCVAGGPHNALSATTAGGPCRPECPAPAPATARLDCATVAAGTGTAPTGSAAHAAGGAWRTPATDTETHIRKSSGSRTGTIRQPGAGSGERPGCAPVAGHAGSTASRGRRRRAGDSWLVDRSFQLLYGNGQRRCQAMNRRPTTRRCTSTRSNTTDSRRNCKRSDS